LSRLEALVMAIMRAWIPLAVLGAVIVGCTPDASVNEAYQGCTVDSECGDGGLVCRRGFCVVDLELTPGACLVGDGVVLNGDRTDCYTGPEGTLDVGRCRAGEQECFNGELTSCLGEVLPRVEMCNGRDDNCDGVVDNLEEVACDTGMLGRCMEGRLMCRGSLAACEPVHEPRKEECNGLDDDCDGVVDNDVSMPCYPQGESGCVEQADGSFDCMGLCQPGSFECVDGAIVGTCSGHVTPEDETLETCGDGLDQSCSGTPDEGCGCTGAETQPCYTGPSATRGIGACHDGVQTCDGGSFGPCVGDQTPVPETCANMDPSWEPGADPATLGVQYDNDCNGIVDDVPNLGEQCIDDAAQGVCRRGTWWCDMEQPAGVPGDRMQYARAFGRGHLRRHRPQLRRHGGHRLRPPQRQRQLRRVRQRVQRRAPVLPGRVHEPANQRGRVRHLRHAVRGGAFMLQRGVRGHADEHQPLRRVRRGVHAGGDVQRGPVLRCQPDQLRRHLREHADEHQPLRELWPDMRAWGNVPRRLLLSRPVLHLLTDAEPELSWEGEARIHPR
jgi:hypothetical protein